MKKLFIIFISISIFTCCKTVIRIGDLNTVSNRNIENKEYISLKRYSGGSKKEIKRSKSKSIEEAIDKTVKNVDGGEFIKNAKIYIIKKRKKQYFAIEGDVWGLK